MKPVILGMNSKTGEALGLLPTTGAGARLWKCSGYTLREYLDTFDRMNLLEEPEWNDKEARSSSKAIKERLKGRRIIVLGSVVWTALSLPKLLPCDFYVNVNDLTTWYFVPHPSGKNIWYNDNKNREKVRELFQKFREER